MFDLMLLRFLKRAISYEMILTDASAGFRFNAGKIYTYIGEVCVSVNPYRTMNIYGSDVVNQYKGKTYGLH